MGTKWWLLCVLYQALITTSFGTITLPFIDGEASPPPINHKLRKDILEYLKSKYLGTSPQSSCIDEFSSPALVTSSSRVLPGPKIGTAVETVDDLANTIPQSSLLLPVPPYKPDLRFKPNVYMENSVPLNNLVKLNLSPTVQNINEGSIPNGISLPSINSLPIISLESLKRKIEHLAGGAYCPNSLTNKPSYKHSFDNKIYIGGVPFSNPLYNLQYPLRYNQLSLPDVLPPSHMVLSGLNPISNVESLKITNPNNLKIANNLVNTLNSYQPSSIQGLCSLCLPPQACATMNENPNVFITQRVPKVPLLISTSPDKYLERQQHGYLNQPIQRRKFDTLNDRFLIDIGVPLPYLKNYDFSHLTSGFNLANPCYPTASSYKSLRALPEPIIPNANKFDFTIPDFNYESSPLYINNYCSCDSQHNIELLVDVGTNCNTHENNEDYFISFSTDTAVSEIPNDITSFIKKQEMPYENEKLLDVLLLNTNENTLPQIVIESIPCTMSEIFSSPSISYPPKLPQTVFPAIYINTSPSYSLSQSSSNAISSINDIVSTITQTILNSFVPCLTSSTMKSKVPSIVRSNPYSTSSLKFDVPQLVPPINLYNTNIVNPNIPQFIYTQTNVPLNTYSASTFLPLEPLSTTSSLNVIIPSFYDEIPSTSVNFYTNDLTASTFDTSLPPPKVTLLPPTSFVDYLPSQPCPSTLPLPSLPSYLDMTGAFSAQPQVLKVKFLDKKAKTIERLLEMVFLAELLNGEGYIDFDSLDTVLAILCAN